VDVFRPPPQPVPTGRYLLLCRTVGDSNTPKALRDKAGLTLATSSDFDRATMGVAQFGGADGLYLETLGVVVTSVPPAQLAPLMTAPGAGGLVAVEPEYYVYGCQVPRRSDFAPLTLPRSLDESGVRAADSGALVCALTEGVSEQAIHVLDESAVTWGLTATRVTESRWTGRGVRVAVLDTGLALDHPDFAGRPVVSQSFVEGEDVQDGHFHGTFCAGTAVGNGRPERLPRYGVAPDAELFVAKVLDNKAVGKVGYGLAGVEWAIKHGCRIVSYSVAGPMPAGQFSQVFEAAAQRALAANTLIIAATGNSSKRPDSITGVESPGNCPSIMAVGAIDAQMQIASFSARTLAAANGGTVDIVGPGVGIYSSIPLPRRYGRANGTSFACPHVSGIAALYAEANPRATANELWQLLVNNVRKLDLDKADAGAGLVQAPV
jgi:subtilisin family serine protease